jgi:hypothetical protein
MDLHLVLYYGSIVLFVYILLKLRRLFKARKRLSKNLRAQLQ